jgi:hypothetical protein
LALVLTMALNLLRPLALHMGLMLDMNLVEILRLSVTLSLDYLTLVHVFPTKFHGCTYASSHAEYKNLIIEDLQYIF